MRNGRQFGYAAKIIGLVLVAGALWGCRVERPDGLDGDKGGPAPTRAGVGGVGGMVGDGSAGSQPTESGGAGGGSVGGRSGGGGGAGGADSRGGPGSNADGAVAGAGGLGGVQGGGVGVAGGIGGGLAGGGPGGGQPNGGGVDGGALDGAGGTGVGGGGYGGAGPGAGGGGAGAGPGAGGGGAGGEGTGGETGQPGGGGAAGSSGAGGAGASGGDAGGVSTVDAWVGKWSGQATYLVTTYVSDPVTGDVMAVTENHGVSAALEIDEFASDETSKGWGLFTGRMGASECIVTAGVQAMVFFGDSISSVPAPLITGSGAGVDRSGQMMALRLMGERRGMAMVVKLSFQSDVRQAPPCDQRDLSLTLVRVP
jgi:hypothetical protein